MADLIAILFGWIETFLDTGGQAVADGITETGSQAGGMLASILGVDNGFAIMMVLIIFTTILLMGYKYQ